MSAPRGAQVAGHGPPAPARRRRPAAGEEAVRAGAGEDEAAGGPTLRVHPHWVGPGIRLLAPALLAAAAVALQAANLVTAEPVLWLLGLAAAWAAGVWASWAASSLTVTPRHLAIDAGVVARVSQVIPLEAIHEVTCRQTLWGRLLDYGILELDLLGSHEPCLFHPAPSPRRLRRHILASKARLQEESRGPPNPSPCASHPHVTTLRRIDSTPAVRPARAVAASTATSRPRSSVDW